MSVSYAQSPFDIKSAGLTLSSPWATFDKAWQAVMGYPAAKFKIDEGKTLMTSGKETAIVITLYYIVILGGRELMRNRPAFKLNDLFLIHNFYLTAVSGSLLALFIEQLVPSLWNYGVFDAICGGSGWTKELTTLYYLNYLTKYVELIDTVFLVLKKKPLTFLHCYHHGATALLCYTQLIGHTPVSWVPITLNLMVHVVMYWYYFQSARGIRITWKKWITRLQIIQFVIDLGFVYFATYNYLASTYLQALPHVGTCAGEPFAAFTGCAILSSYLFLFLSFYATTYKKSSKKDTQIAVTAHAVSDLEHKQIPTMAEIDDSAITAIKATNAALKHASAVVTGSDMPMMGMKKD